MQWLPCAASIHDAAVATARFGHSAVCISGTGSVWGTDLVVVFGGVSYSDGESALEHHAALADVTVLQAESDMWFAPQVSPATPEGGLPEPRAFHCAAAVDRRMYVFGGHVMSYDPVMNKKRRRFFNDLWCLDTDTWTWQCLGPGPVFSSEVPPRRDMATLTRAGAATLLLFGGRLESGRVAGDAWLLDTNTHTWSQLRMPGPSPPPRKMHAALFMNSRVVLFGGERDAGGLLDDLWTLKGADGSEPAKWTQIKLRPAPSGRFGHAMAGYGRRLAVFGGCLDQSGLLSFSRTYVQCNELWVLDMGTFSWHRVDPPEGALTLSGSALEDPSLLPLLQQQAAQEQQQQGGQQGQQQQEAPPPHHHHQQPAAPHPHQAHQALVPLPLERMCHSLVPVGAEGQLLLVGGRKRDGICEDAWWLAMGPDDLTPVLTAPRPGALATALLAVTANRPAQPRAVHTPPAPAAAAAAAQPPPPPAPASPAAPVPVLANPTLLANLLRRSAPPMAAAAASASAAGAGAGVDAAHGRQQHSPQHPPQHHYAPPQLLSPSGRTAAASAAAAGGGSAVSLNSSSGSALDAAAASALVPVPASYPVPGADAVPGSGSGPRVGIAVSKSTGSIMAQDAGGAAQGGSFSGGGQLQHGQTSGAGAGAGGVAAAAGRERMADKASLAFNRLTRQVSTLLSKDAGAAAPAAAAAAAGSTAATAGQLSTSPTGGGVGILARLLDGSAGRGGTAAVATAVAPPGPPPPPVGPQLPSTVADGSKSSPASPAGLAASPSLPPDLRGPLERLRAGLGLPPLGSPSASAGASDGSSPGRGAGGPGGPAASGCADPGSALAALGRRLAATDGGGGGRGGGDLDVDGAVVLARSHLAASSPERLTVGQLGVVLADCQALLKARAVAAWERLEQDEQLAARQRSGGGVDVGSGGGVIGSGGGGNVAVAAAMDPAALSCLVASQSHWLAGVRSEELRLGDVGRLVASYGELVAGGRR